MDEPEPLPRDTAGKQEPPVGRQIVVGTGACLLGHLVLFIICEIFLEPVMFMLVGLVQVIYVVPLAIIALFRQQPFQLIGLLITAGLTILGSVVGCFAAISIH